MREKRIFFGTKQLSLTLAFAVLTGFGGGRESQAASVSQGPASTTVTDLFPAGGRVAGLGKIMAIDNTNWTVPAQVNFTDPVFPIAPDLHNIYGSSFNTAAQALAALDGSEVVTIDAAGELVAAYIFADNYFELYINGVPVGKDAVPFTSFNSHLVRFRVQRPFTVAMKLVDWEENLGLGSESNRGFAFHAGDGGMVAVFKDAAGATIATTDSDWKAQTFYTAPIKTLGCLIEANNIRDSSACDESGSNDGSAYYAYHWAINAQWFAPAYDDSAWPAAAVFTNEMIGVGNKPSYTNFTATFDDPVADARFIWSANVVLDNLVLVRYTVN